eukprot:1148314-Pelagomonas_calceolata.AAC.9
MEQRSATRTHSHTRTPATSLYLRVKGMPRRGQRGPGRLFGRHWQPVCNISNMGRVTFSS